MTIGNVYAHARVFLMAHEKLVLAVIAGLVLWFSIGKIDTLIANHDNANLHQAQVVADQQAAVNAGLAQQAAYQAAQYKELAAQVAKQNAQLEAANVALSNALVKQQHTDATLPPSELIVRWAQLVPNAEVSILTDGRIAVPQPTAVATVQQLEEVPVLRTQLGNTRTQLGDAQALVTASGQQVATLNTEVGSLRVQITDNAKVCDARVKVVTDAAKKSKRHWLYAGMVIGFIGRQLIKSETGF
jgi:hypothetical protein